MSKIIPVHVITYNGQDVNTIHGLNSNRIFDEITPHKDGATILYHIGTSQNRRDVLLISDSPVEIYRGMSMPINPTSVTLSLVGSGSVTVSIEDVVFCYGDVNNFAQSYLRVLSNDVETLYHVDMSLLDLIETLNESDGYPTQYTDAKAIAACNLDGTLYLSIPGIAFMSEFPDTLDFSLNNDGYINTDQDFVNYFTAVNLPNGATVTGVIVYGNAAAEAETWYLRRTNLTNASMDEMATAVINTADASIITPVIDNYTYAYFIYTTSLDTDDRIIGARISYTL